MLWFAVVLSCIIISSVVLSTLQRFLTKVFGLIGCVMACARMVGSSDAWLQGRVCMGRWGLDAAAETSMPLWNTGGMSARCTTESLEVSLKGFWSQLTHTLY